MAKFLLTYTAGSMAESQADQAKVMEAWGAWFSQLGAATVDPGNPTGATKTVSPGGGVSDDVSGPTGYSIISVDSIDHALAAAKMCPVLAGGGSVQVSEIIPVM